MKAKIVKTILLFIGLFVGFYLINLLGYENSQEYAKIATQQVNDDDFAYTALRTNGLSSALIYILNWVLGSLVLFGGYMIWKKKEATV